MAVLRYLRTSVFLRSHEMNLRLSCFSGSGNRWHSAVLSGLELLYACEALAYSFQARARRSSEACMAVAPGERLERWLRVCVRTGRPSTLLASGAVAERRRPAWPGGRRPSGLGRCVCSPYGDLRVRLPEMVDPALSGLRPESVRLSNGSLPVALRAREPTELARSKSSF